MMRTLSNNNRNNRNSHNGLSGTGRLSGALLPAVSRCFFAALIFCTAYLTTITVNI
ncbi:MAG: hypothetical protein WC989_00390 [Micavibrio sp.]